MIASSDVGMSSQNVPIEQVVSEHAERLMSLDEAITGVGAGISDRSDEPVIKVYISEPNSDLVNKLPKRLGNYPVEIEVTGEFHTLPAC
jgi:hypothetical protein